MPDSPTIVPEITRHTPLFTVSLTCLLQEARAANPIDPQRVDRCIDEAIFLLRHTAPDSDFPDTSHIFQFGSPLKVKPLTTGIGNGLAPWQAQRVKDHIAANLADRLSIGELSEQVRLSSSHFTRTFKATFGLTPRAYIMEQRILRAGHLMLSTNHSLAEVALNCGLSDQAHLSRLFRRIRGQSPSAWRRHQPATIAT